MGSPRVCRASAPAKVILFGEHFVVEGVPAIAAAVSLYTTAVARQPGEGGGVRVCSEGYGCREVWPSKPSSMSQLYHALEKLACTAKLRPALVEVSSEIPVGAGLGSSAAFAAAVLAAYTCYLGLELSREQLSELVYEAERVVHGKPSGIDNTTIVHGGFILFEKGKGFHRLEAKLRGSKLVIAFSVVARSPGEAVRRVLERKKRLGRLGDDLYELAKRLVLEALAALRAGDPVRLGELMDVNHGLLNALGVSTPVIEELVYAARRAGALGAKLTGAGLGGSIIALAWEDDVDKVVKALSSKAASVYVTELGVPGVTWTVLSGC